VNYYQKHLGDYAKKTGHLTPLEHGVYNLVLDGYYDREQGPTLIDATRWARARTEEEKSAVLAVLDEFFTLGEDGRYRQSRVEDELTDYRARAETNRAIAVERERKKKERKEHAASTSRAPDVHHEANLADQNREPSHKPIANSQDIDKTLSAIPADEQLPAQSVTPEPAKPSKRFVFTEEDRQCAAWLFERIRAVSPNHKPPNLEAWAHDVRLAREQDARTHHEICELFAWAQKDQFWRANILSPAKLREKWDQLTIKRGTPQKGQQHGNFGSQDYRAGVGADGSF